MADLLTLGLLGGGLFLGAKALGKKKPKKKKKNGNGANGNGTNGDDDEDDDNGGVVIEEVTWVPVNPPADPDEDPSGTPGEKCPISVTGSGNYGVWDDNGECRIYWQKGITAETVRELALAAWQEAGEPEAACTGDEYIEHRDEWVWNQTLVPIVAVAMQALYNQPAGVFPPVEESHMWVQHSWKLAWVEAHEEICGWSPSPQGT